MILTILNAISIILCIYVLVSKKYKTDDIRVSLLYICLNIIFMGRLWLVLDPSQTIGLVYASVNYIAFIALFLITSLVKKKVILVKYDISKRLYCVLKPIKTKFNSIIGYFKQNKYNK